MTQYPISTFTQFNLSAKSIYMQMGNIPELSYLTKMGEELLQLFNKKEDHAYGRVSSGGTEKGNRFIVTQLEEFK